MSKRVLLSRRALFAVIPTLVGLRGTPLGAAPLTEADRGLGGTGAAPDEPTGDDRGIGGTGVIGTIRRFGSIVVNDLRITFPRSVGVMIDGRQAALADLKLGHVVQVLATHEADHLSTQMIAAFSEVAGPVEALGDGGMVVLGQHVTLPVTMKAPPWQKGDFVAVSGLRRLDGVIVASLVEPRSGDEVRLAGPAAWSQDGILRIGDLPIQGLDAKLAGKRVEVTGELNQGVLRVTRMVSGPFAHLDAKASRLSVEAYVAYERHDLRLGSGLSVETDGAVASVSPSGDPVHAIVSAAVEQNGALRLQSLRIKSDAHEGPGSKARSGQSPGPSGMFGGSKAGPNGGPGYGGGMPAHGGPGGPGGVGGPGRGSKP